ncbi:wlm domain-containing protein [Rutstroemia sp. NJR-2017a BBW]|nr:wlm domain-containing protein [Rutstroemia sp. NJR-2017a BBW]PQE08606.1 wlm domain-containing protein [Rutstroemia sp. NJR-2017a BBW]
MPLGWERINARRTQPNKNIVFIKPRPGPDESQSQEFLERIAAQCLPIMNKNHLSVASLEEYEPNLEFWGRNFNNGEGIQLVLKSPSTGRWLPFKFVQMVMMHELAHCKQMNHSGAFWKVRNEYAAEMKGLWEKGYTGDGLWGRGVLLEDGAFMGDELADGEVLPEHLCGGTFRSRGGKKRKAKPKITYKEQKERRIRKKFGVNGMKLGEDEEAKAVLEKGKVGLGKPRVANSARGRELRAAAALARFEVKKEEPAIKDEDLVTDSEAESGQEDDVYIKAEPDDALDLDGSRLVDRSGRGMVRVCEDEDKDNEDAKKEMNELRSIERYFKPKIKSESRDNADSEAIQEKAKLKELAKSKTGSVSTRESQLGKDMSTKEPAAKKSSSLESPLVSAKTIPQTSKTIAATTNSSPCPICSFENEARTLTCTRSRLLELLQLDM